jgi:hypothetical protein
MEITVYTKSQQKRELIQRLFGIYADLLKIKHRTASVNIALRRDVNSEHEADGLTLSIDRDIFIFIQSTLSFGDTARVLAHEMVHTKQHLLGQLVHREKNGKCQTYWMGRLCKKEYLDQPWEIAAYSQESMLLHRALHIINEESHGH